MEFHRCRNKYAVLSAMIAVLVLAGCSSARDPADPQLKALNTIRTQLELPISPLEFVEMTFASNSPRSLEVAVYQDSAGRKYYIDPLSNQVVEIDARSVLPNIPPEAALMPEEIRAKALKFISATIPGFDTLQANWEYEEGNKGDNYFFSWYGEMGAGSFNRPFAQIAIHKSGILFAYYNTLLLDK